MAHPADGKRLITLFGGAAIQVDGAPLGGRASHRHPLALLALLVANGGRPITRDKLIALLWPERDADGGRNLLKVNVHELRKQLGDTALRSTGDQLSLDVGEVACDVTDFLAALAAGDDARAVSLYRGAFLDGFFLKEAAEFEQWADRERARLATMYGEALDRLATAAEARGDIAAAVRWRRAHAEHDPFHPDVAHRLVEALAASGDRAGAIQFAESFSERRRREFEISDDHDIVGYARQARSGAASYRPSPSGGPTAATITPAVAVPVVLEVPAIAPPPPPPPPSARRVRGGFLFAAAIGVVAIAGIVLASRASRRGRAAVAATDDAMAIAPLRAVGADSALRDGIVELLAARFTGEGGPRAIDPARAQSAWPSQTPSLDQSLAGARRLGASRLLAGEIASARDSTAITLRLYGTADGRQIASARADVSSGASLASVADRLTIEILGRAAREPEDRLPGIARRPLAAARTYLAAQLAYRSARYAQAESLYARALTADSTFGAAGLGLAMANSWTVINEHYGVGRDAALRNIATMSERDRLFTRAFFGPDPALGAPQPAPVFLTRWEDLVEKYPDWTEAWYQLGDRYYHFGGLSGLADPNERARYAFRRALEQDSTFAAPLHHLVELYAARHELPDLRGAGDRYFAANPSVQRDRSAIGWEMAMALGDSAWLGRARAAFDSMPREELTRIAWVTDVNGWPRADAERAAKLVDRKSGTASEHEKASILLLTLSVNAGDRNGARTAASALGTLFPDSPVGALWDMYAALFAWNDTTLAADAARRLDAFAHAPLSGDHVRNDQHHLAVCMEGYWQASRGDVEAASASAARLSAEMRGETNNFAARNGRVCLAILQASIATGRKAPDARRVVAQLDTILLRERVPPHVILEIGTLAAARLHATLGELPQALVAARRREHLTGDPTFLASELEAEARYAAATGDSAGAQRAATHLQALRSARAR